MEGKAPQERKLPDGIPSMRTVTEDCGMPESQMRRLSKLPLTVSGGGGNPSLGPTWAAKPAALLRRQLQRPFPGMARPLSLRVLAAGASAALLLASCQQKPSAELQQLQQRQEQLEVKIQQLEQKLNAVAPGNGADPAGKPPAGSIKSLTYRSGTADDRLRIYWADGSTTNLPCKQEQATLVCG
jgi:outer membrane murein-binding lipoprotein Lpp